MNLHNDVAALELPHRRPTTPIMRVLRLSSLSRVLTIVCALFLVAHVAAQDALIEPGLRLAVIDTPHIHALVPAHDAPALEASIIQADAIYVRLAHDARYTIRRPLYVLVTDSFDTHNGYSFVTPYPLIHIQLAPAPPSSSIFTGGESFIRTFIHEITHHISNDRNDGFRGALESIFGRILPSDFLSIGVAYLSTPAHQTMPTFWHEGLAQWAETTYASPDSVWGGRGRDSFSHMVWRLDVAAGSVPPPGNWHYSYHRWPFGSETYLYGLAYLRYLDATYGAQVSPWVFAEQQSHQWAFCFDNAPYPLVQRHHSTLIEDASAALMQEQRENIAILQQQPVTHAKRLTPPDFRLGAPCWTPNGQLFAALDDPCDHPRFARVDAAGAITWTSTYAFDLSSSRSLSDGTIIYSVIPEAGDNYRHSQVHIQSASGRDITLYTQRLLQPDIRSIDALHNSSTDMKQICAIRLCPLGQQELVLTNVALPSSWWQTMPEEQWTIHPTMGRPWTPTFRPSHDALCWVETDDAGSHLILATLATPRDRTVLANIPGRILHPSWSADGKYLFICADHSGVPNAYRIDPDAPGIVVPVTNTIGGIIACVPSPDGKELAVIDHDHHGPFLARIANDPASWPSTIPSLSLAWPGHLPANLTPALTTSTPASSTSVINDAQPTTSEINSLPSTAEIVADKTAEKKSPAHISSYHGFAEIRPLFWTPTTLPVPEGGLGIIGVAADPAQTHQLIASLGTGPVEHVPVGLAAWSYAGWPVNIAALAWRSERTYGDQLITNDGLVRDYTEQKSSGELRVGYGLSGSARRWQTWVAAGISHQQVVQKAADRYEGIAVIGTDPFQGHERYIETTLAYDSSMFFPMSYAREDGPSIMFTARQSGFDGDFVGRRIETKGSWVFSVVPNWGQQIIIGGALGWSNSDRYLQGQFHSGGNVAYGLPRGYPSFQTSGAHLLGWSSAWRTPIWRPFTGHGTSPLVSRQTVAEFFYEGAKVTNDHLNGTGPWVRSAGGELHWSFSFWETLFNPGIGLAKQIDFHQDWSTYFTLDFRW